MLRMCKLFCIKLLDNLNSKCKNQGIQLFFFFLVYLGFCFALYFGWWNKNIWKMYFRNIIQPVLQCSKISNMINFFKWSNWHHQDMLGIKVSDFVLVLTIILWAVHFLFSNIVNRLFPFLRHRSVFWFHDTLPM